VRKEACWLISNIAAGSQSQISLIIEHSHYIEALKKALTEDLQDVVTEAAWSLGNLASGASMEQIGKLVNEYGYLGCLKAMLGNFSQKVKQIGLEACLNVLNSGGDVKNNVYVKSFIGEGLIPQIKEVLSNGTQAQINLVEDILAFFKQSEDKKEGELDENKEQGIKPLNKDEDSDDEDEEEEEEEEPCHYENRQEEEDDEKYKYMERED